MRMQHIEYGDESTVPSQVTLTDSQGSDSGADTNDDKAIVPRATVETIIRQRNRALELYGDAHAALAAASAAVGKARAATHAIQNGEDRYNHHLQGEKAEFLRAVGVPERAEYMERARKITDTDVWSRIITITDLEALMDKEAKDELHQQLLTDPPEGTVQNVYATLQQFVVDADMIFRRGIANCFSNLDRRFRSHDGFKIGSRIILDRMFNEHGWWNYQRDMESTLLDIERTFFVLEGISYRASYGGIVGLLRDRRQAFRGAQQDIIENEFFKVCVYKNGNAHVWFKRDDLLIKVNKLLAEYYGKSSGRTNAGG